MIMDLGMLVLLTLLTPVRFFMKLSQQEAMGYTKHLTWVISFNVQFNEVESLFTLLYNDKNQKP